jgi:hypothetical protein
MLAQKFYHTLVNFGRHRLAKTVMQALFFLQQFSARRRAADIRAASGQALARVNLNVSRSISRQTQQRCFAGFSPASQTGSLRCMAHKLRCPFTRRQISFCK